MNSVTRAYTEVYLHAVWGTWNRMPLITDELRERVYGCLAHQSRRLGADTLAIGGVADHVHVLVRLPSTISIADFVGKLKGASSHMVTHVLRHPEFFRWQRGYGAFSVSRRGIPVVRDYVLNQEEHHRAGTVLRTLERTSE